MSVRKALYPLKSVDNTNNNNNNNEGLEGFGFKRSLISKKGSLDSNECEIKDEEKIIKKKSKSQLRKKRHFNVKNENSNETQIKKRIKTQTDQNNSNHENENQIKTEKKSENVIDDENQCEKTREFWKSEFLFQEQSLDESNKQNEEFEEEFKNLKERNKELQTEFDGSFEETQNLIITVKELIKERRNSIGGYNNDYENLDPFSEDYWKLMLEREDKKLNELHLEKNELELKISQMNENKEKIQRKLDAVLHRAAQYINIYENLTNAKKVLAMET